MCQSLLTYNYLTRELLFRREINENEGQLSNLNTVCLDVSIIKETPEETMRR